MSYRPPIPQSNQLINGAVSITNLPAVQVVAGTVTGTVSGNVTVTNLPSDQLIHGPVSITNFPATQPVSGTVAVNNFPATTSVSNFPASQAVTGTVGINNFPANQTTTVSNFPATQTIAGTVTLDVKTGKTPVIATGFVGTAATTTVTIATYTVPAGKTFFLQFFEASVRRSTFAGTQTGFGQMFFNTPGGTYLWDACGPGFVEMAPIQLAEPMPFNAGSVISWTVGPADTTAFVWEANFGGYLR